MSFFTSGVDTIQKILILVGAAIGLWGAVNLFEGYGHDNPTAKNQGIKQFVAGAGIVMLATLLLPQLKGLFS